MNHPKIESTIEKNKGCVLVLNDELSEVVGWIRQCSLPALAEARERARNLVTGDQRCFCIEANPIIRQLLTSPEEVGDSPYRRL